MLDIFIYILHYVHPKSYIELPVRSQKGLNPSFCLWLITFESGPNLLQLSICSIDAASCFGCFSVFTDQFSLARALSTAIRPSFPVGHAMKSSHLDWLVAIVELATKKSKCVIWSVIRVSSWTNSSSKNPFGECMHSFWPILHYYTYNFSHHVGYFFQSALHNAYPKQVSDSGKYFRLNPTKSEELYLPHCCIIEVLYRNIFLVVWSNVR